MLPETIGIFGISYKVEALQDVGNDDVATWSTPKAHILIRKGPCEENNLIDAWIHAVCDTCSIKVTKEITGVLAGNLIAKGFSLLPEKLPKYSKDFPKKVSIQGNVIPIIVSSRARNSSKIGEWDYSLGCIWVSDKCPLEQKEVTLVHEFVHACLGLCSITHSETFVAFFANILYEKGFRVR